MDGGEYAKDEYKGFMLRMNTKHNILVRTKKTKSRFKHISLTKTQVSKKLKTMKNEVWFRQM